MNRDKIKSVLIDARALIDTPERWTQGADRRDAEGRDIGFSTPEAITCRCAGAAIQEVTSSDLEFKEPASFLLSVIKVNTGVDFDFVCLWNDHHKRTHTEVLQAFDGAIKAINDQSQDP